MKRPKVNHVRAMLLMQQLILEQQHKPWMTVPVSHPAGNQNSDANSDSTIGAKSLEQLMNSSIHLERSSLSCSSRVDE